MTEPPDPRHPPRGGGEEDYDAAWDNADADEILDGLEDDVLLDSIAQGVHGELGPDALTELLAGLRDVPDAVDIPVPNTARVEREENVLPPRTQEGTPSMAISEDAATLRLIAGEQGENQAFGQVTADLEASVAVLQSVVTGIVSDTNAAVAAAGQGSDDANTIQSAGEHAGNALEDAMAALQNAQTAVAQAAEHCGAFRSTVGDVATKHGA